MFKQTLIKIFTDFSNPDLTDVFTDARPSSSNSHLSASKQFLNADLTDKIKLGADTNPIRLS